MFQTLTNTLKISLTRSNHCDLHNILPLYIITCFCRIYPRHTYFSSCIPRNFSSNISSVSSLISSYKHSIQYLSHLRRNRFPLNLNYLSKQSRFHHQAPIIHYKTTPEKQPVTSLAHNSNINDSQLYLNKAASFKHSNMSACDKLESLRNLMKENKIDAYLVVTGDPHNNEIPCAHDNRREFISNFTGSSGYVLITETKALLWTDGRYFVQAENQLDKNYWELMKLGLSDSVSMSDLLLKSPEIKSVGFDLMCVPTSVIQSLQKKVPKVTFKPFEPSLIDLIWENQPPFPANPIYIFDKVYAGVDTPTKIKNILKEMEKENCSTILISQLDEVAWTLNLRGSDNSESPTFFAFLMISANQKTLFINQMQLSDNALAKLNEENIEIKPYNQLISTLSAMKFDETSKLWLDSVINYGVYSCVNNPEKCIHLNTTPVCLAKAIKNESEIEGMIEAHLHDAMAMCKFFSHLEEILNNKKVFEMNEYQLAQSVDQFRANQAQFVSLSFPTICGSGSNAAIIHYEPTENQASAIAPKMLLIDSGGQYKSGTTDITRTTHLGSPTDEEKLVYTLVLKGHIALAKAVFPASTKGPQLDVLARQFLWNEGLQYFHGTGHGVGSFLNVHEGPCSITPSLSGVSAQTSLVPGMIISNEPGFYNYDKGYGVRIESLILVEKAVTPQNYAETKFFKFKTITKVPINTSFLDMSQLTQSEVDWINNYHKDVAEQIIPLLKKEQENSNLNNTSVIDWIAKTTQPISF